RERSVAHVTEGQCRAADENDLVSKRIGRDGAADDIPHGILRVGAVGTGIVDESRAVMCGPQVVMAELDAFESIGRDVGGNFLVRNLLKLANNLEVQRGKEILVLVAHEQERVAKRAV